MENYHRVAHIQLYVMWNFQFKYFKKEIPICLSPGLNTYKNFKVRMFWIKGLSLSYQAWLSRSKPHTGNQGPVFPSLSCHEERENRKYAQVWGSAGSNKSCSYSSLSTLCPGCAGTRRSLSGASLSLVPLCSQRQGLWHQQLQLLPSATSLRHRSLDPSVSLLPDVTQR